MIGLRPRPLESLCNPPFAASRQELDDQATLEMVPPAAKLQVAHIPPDAIGVRGIAVFQPATGQPPE
jgi:hypothetical protein